MQDTAPAGLFGQVETLISDLVSEVRELRAELQEVRGELDDVREGTGWATVAEIAEHSSMSPDAVYRLLYRAHRNGLADQEVIAKPTGREWRIHRGRWDRWIRNRTPTNALR